MNNPLTKPPLTRTAYTLTLCPNQERRRLRVLQAQLESAVKRLAFVESQLAAAWSKLIQP